MSRIYRGPDGAKLKSKKEEIRLWQKPAETLCKELDLQLIGFHPNYTFGRKDSSETVHLPAWFVCRLAEQLEMLDRNVDGG